VGLAGRLFFALELKTLQPCNPGWLVAASLCDVWLCGWSFPCLFCVANRTTNQNYCTLLLSAIMCSRADSLILFSLSIYLSLILSLCLCHR